jgi:flavin-dependent dehydrogenase
MIAIAGAGISGAYLYRLLKSYGHEVELFDVKADTECGLSSCAWGTSRGFAELVEAAALNPQEFIFRRLDRLVIDGVEIEADLMTFDKPGLIKNLLSEARINYSPLDPMKYDRVVDATGVARAFLPAIDDDIILGCVQYRVDADVDLDNRIRLGGIGYAWRFPLYEGGYHIGCGSLKANPKRIMEDLDWAGISERGSGRSVVCGCGGEIRLTGPHFSLPFVANGADIEVWGVGEAIGCVAPLAGDGVVSGMRSAQLLMDHWDDSEEYEAAILREFDWMKREREVIDKLRRAENLTVKDAWVLKNNSKRMGMRIGLGEAIQLMKNMR